MNTYDERYETLILLMRYRRYEDATPLALELLPSLPVSIEFNDIPSYWIIATLNGEFGGDITPGQFEFSKAIFDLAWTLPLTGNVKMICDMSSSYCDRYINELTQQENVAIRTRAINQLGDSEKRFNLREMLVYLMKTKQYALAWEKGTELEVIDKSEALLFKSHMLRHGLGVNQNIFDALIAEIQSVKFYDLENASIQFSYGESYDEVEGAEFLFDYNFGEGSFELDTDDFIWYLSQSEDKDPLSVATRELKGIGAIDINKMRAN